MAAQLVSNDAIEINRLHLRIVESIRKTKDGMELYTIKAVYAVLLDCIRQIELVMSRPTIRSHQDQNLRIPTVQKNSSWNNILGRLRNQVKAVCTFADLLHTGADANNEELEALVQVKEFLRQTYEDIFPAGPL